MSDEQKKKRAAVQTAWRLLVVAASNVAASDEGIEANRAQFGQFTEGVKKLEAAFPEYLGGL